jgi:hypothetical protein
MAAPRRSKHRNVTPLHGEPSRAPFGSAEWRPVGGDGAKIVLAAPGASPDRHGVRRLAARMDAEGAKGGFGAVETSDGRLTRFPPFVEELRFRQPLAASLAVLERGHLAAVLGEVGWSEADPWRRWRVLRASAEPSLACIVDWPIGRLPRPFDALEQLASAGGRVPIGLAGPRFEPEAGSAEPGIILVYGHLAASVSLYFDGLAPGLRERVRFLQPSDPVSDLPHLAAAALVIIVREFQLLEQRGTLDLLDSMQVPYAWFIDDNMSALAKDYAVLGHYQPDVVARFVARTRGVLVSTEALEQAIAPLGRPVVQWPPVFHAAIAAPAASERHAGAPLRLGVVGGAFRRHAFVEHVLPALDPAPGGPVELYGRLDVVRGVEDKRLRTLPMDESFGQFVHRWRRLGCHALLHPAGDYANMPYKSPATLLAARYLGAVPIVAPEAAYAGLGEDEGVLSAGPDRREWRRALDQVADERRRAVLFGRLDAWCRRSFDPELAFPRYERLRAWMEPPTAAERERRLSRAQAAPGYPELWRRAMGERAAALAAERLFPQERGAGWRFRGPDLARLWRFAKGDRDRNGGT